MLSLGEAKSWPLPLATEGCAKKVRVTPIAKNCISSSSNLTEIINILKLVIEPTLRQENKNASLEGEHMKKDN